jgi:hypothetical protein
LVSETLEALLRRERARHGQYDGDPESSSLERNPPPDKERDRDGKSPD